jgi:hypothetical protein
MPGVRVADVGFVGVQVGVPSLWHPIHLRRVGKPISTEPGYLRCSSLGMRRHLPTSGSAELSLFNLTGHHTSDEVKVRQIGIDADELDAIFEAFHQVGATEREDRGTGLGAAMTKRYAQLLGGSIDADSQLGEGSTEITAHHKTGSP